MTFALLAALTIIIIGVGIMAYLLDVLIDETRATNAELREIRRRGGGKDNAPANHRSRAT